MKLLLVVSTILSRNWRRFRPSADPRFLLALQRFRNRNAVVPQISGGSECTCEQTCEWLHFLEQLFKVAFQLMSPD